MAKTKQKEVEQVKEEKPKKLWTRYLVTWIFPENLFGSVPKSEEIIKKWLESRKPKVRPPSSKSIEEVQSEVMETLMKPEPTQEEEIQAVALGFQYVDGAMVMGGRTVRAHFKDCARIVGKMFTGKVEGEYGLGWKFTNGVYPEDYYIPVTRQDGSPVNGPDGAKELFVHAQGPRGPVNAIKLVDYVSNVKMQFTLRALSGIRMSDIENVMNYGSIHGYAGERSTGEGRYLYEIKEV